MKQLKSDKKRGDLQNQTANFSWIIKEVAVAEWLARWLHMQEVRGSNPGQGNFIFVAKHFKIRQKCGDLEISCATSILIYSDNTLKDK